MAIHITQNDKRPSIQALFKIATCVHGGNNLVCDPSKICFERYVELISSSLDTLDGLLKLFSLGLKRCLDF